MKPLRTSTASRTPPAWTTWFAFGILLAVLPAPGSARTAIDVGDARDTFEIGRYAEFCLDPGGRLDVDTLLARPDACPFEPSDGWIPVLGFSSGRAWLRFTLFNSRPVPLERDIALDLPNARRVLLYRLLPGGGAVPSASGWDVTDGDDDTRSALPSFAVVLPPDSHTDFLLAVEDDSGLVLDVVVQTPQARAFSVGRLVAAYDVYALGMLFLALFQAAAFLLNRSRAYLLLIPFMLSHTLLNYLGSGVAAVHLGRDWAEPLHHAASVAGALAAPTGLLFVRAFLELDRAAPRLDRVVRLALVASILLVPLALAGPVLAGITSSVGRLLSMGLHVAGAVVVGRQGRLSARIYLAGAALFSISAFLGVMLSLGLLPRLPGVLVVIAAGFPVLTLASILSLKVESSVSLVRAHERYRTIADFTADWEYWQGPDGAMRYVSPSCERVTGRVPDEFVRDPGLLSALVEPEDRAAWDRHVCACGPATGRAHEIGSDPIVFRIRRTDGNVRWVEHQCRRVFLPDGTDAGVRGSNRDVTRREEAHRTLDVQRARIEQMARVAAAGGLAAAVAHEVNQPLASIRSLAQGGLRYLDRAPPELGQVRKALEGVVADDRRAAEVVKRLGGLFKGEYRHDYPVPLEAVVQRVLDILRPDLVRAGISTGFDVAAGTRPLRGDRLQLEQVVYNLVTNAVAAIERSGARSGRVSIAIGPADADAIELSIRDTGTGIAADVAETLFEPFVTTRAAGLGVGLSVCRTIVEAHGGTIQADNGEGGGAVFRVRLPVGKEETTT